jgi:hypothetical protein
VASLGEGKGRGEEKQTGPKSLRGKNRLRLRGRKDLKYGDLNQDLKFNQV